MKMNDVLNLLPALFGGIILGILFFGGLWLTVRKGLTSKRPGIIFIVSLILRMGIVVMGFYYIGGDSWQKMVVCLVGFLMARIAIFHLTKKDKQTQTAVINEVNNEN